MRVMVLTGADPRYSAFNDFVRPLAYREHPGEQIEFHHAFPVGADGANALIRELQEPDTHILLDLATTDRYLDIAKVLHPEIPSPRFNDAVVRDRLSVLSMVPSLDEPNETLLLHSRAYGKQTGDDHLKYILGVPIEREGIFA